VEPIWDWGNNIIVAIQAVHNPALDSLFNAITFLGEAEFLLLIFPLVVWSVNKSVGYRLAYLVLVSITLNTWAKLIINHPRPFEWPSVTTSPVLKLNLKAGGPGIPSGHTQTSLTLWFYLAYKFRRIWLWGAAAGLFALVSFSRIYLGVHFPTDILGGAGLGLIILLLFIKLESQLIPVLLAPTARLQIGLAVVIPLLIILIHPHPDTIATVGTLSGFSLGIIFEREKVDFQATGSITQRLTRYLVGLTLLVIIYLGSDFVMPAPETIWYLPVKITRYAVSGFWVSGAAPWLFKRTKLVSLQNQVFM
jgi:membrane-associated phospholipid phosphatase